MSSGSAQQYPVIPTAVLEMIPVITWSAEDAVLALWVPTAMKPEGMRVMHAWGFKYKTTLYWVKTGKIGMGFWFRNQVEECLIGIRGRVTPFRLAVRNVHIAPAVGKHSTKPAMFPALLEAACGSPRLELFAREPRPNWTAWGFGTGVDVLSIPARRVK
jgi:N6-adenosine-specific RNA methylase IME4